jgi:hypothetical protein
MKQTPKKCHHYLVYKTEFHVKRAALGKANRNLAAPWRVCMMLVFASLRDFCSQPLPIPIFFSSDVSRSFQSSAKFGRKVTHLTKNFRLIFRPIFGRLEWASIKVHKPMQYAGQNLSKLAEDFRDDAKKLTIAGFYDHGLTLTTLKIFLEAALCMKTKEERM